MHQVAVDYLPSSSISSSSFKKYWSGFGQISSLITSPKSSPDASVWSLNHEKKRLTSLWARFLPVLSAFNSGFSSSVKFYFGEVICWGWPKTCDWTHQPKNTSCHLLCLASTWSGLTCTMARHVHSNETLLKWPRSRRMDSWCGQSGNWSCSLTWCLRTLVLQLFLNSVMP